MSTPVPTPKRLPVEPLKPAEPGADRALLERLCGAVPAGLLVLRDERIVYANPALETLLGLGAAALVGAPFESLVAEEHREQAVQRLRTRQRSQAAPQRYEVNLLGANGLRVPVELEARALADGEQVAVIREINGRVREAVYSRQLFDLLGRMQTARSEEAVWTAAEQGLDALGIRLAQLRFVDGQMRLVRWTAPTRVLGALEAVLGRRVFDLPLGPSNAPWIEALFALARVRFEEDVLDRVTRAFGGDDRQLRAVELALAGSGHSKAVLAPLLRDGHRDGVVALFTDTLTSAEAGALGLFIPQLSSALEMARSIEDLERRNLQLSTIQALAAAGVEQDFEVLLPALAKLSGDAIGAQMVTIRLLDPERDVLVLAAAVGGQVLPQPRREAVRFAEIGWGDGARSMAFPLEAIGPPMRGPYQAEGLRQFALVPLLAADRVVGAIAFSRRDERPFVLDELRFAEAMAQQIAIHVERHLVAEKERRRVELMELLFGLTRVGTEALEVAPLAERALGQLVSVLAVETATLHVLRDGRLALAGRSHAIKPRDVAPSASDPLRELLDLPVDDQSLNGRAALTRKLQVQEGGEDWPGHTHALARRRRARHGVALPLLVQDRLVGTLMVARQEDRRFTGEELKLLEGAAGHLAVALEQARLFEEERRHVRELQLMLELSGVVTASLELPQILATAAVSLVRIVEASHSYIWLLDEDRKHLRGVATSAPDHRAHFLQVSLTEDQGSLAWAAVRSRQAMRAHDVSANPEVQKELVKLYVPRSMVAVPLLVQDVAIGAVVITDQRRMRAWPDSELEPVTVLARQVAVGATNARLFQTLKRSYETLARTQEELVKREKLAALGELSAVMAHEVRNPLAVIFNSLAALRKELKPAGNAAMLLDILREESERLNRIVGELLDFARPPHAELRAEAVETVISGALEAARNMVRAPKVKVAIEVERGLTAPVDGQLLRQALVNLFTNALQAMPGGGTLAVRAAVEEGSAHVRIEVADSGPGIAPDVADRVFQPFFSTKATGTGLGLAVVKRIAEAHRGEIQLTSRLGEGTRFTLRLPLDVDR